METATQPQYDIFSLGFDKFLSRENPLVLSGTGNEEMSSLPSVLGNSVTDGTLPVDLASGEWVGNVSIKDGYLQSSNFVTNSTGWKIDYLGNVEFNSGYFRGTLTAGSIHIPDTITANSFHVDTSGNAWWGATVIGSATAKILNTGAATFTDIIATGTINAQAGYLASGVYIDTVDAILCESAGLNVGVAGHIRGGQTDFNVLTGFFIGYSAGAYKFSVGVPAGNRITFDGANININAQHSNFTLYDAVVDAAGYGDYTTIGAAVTAGALRIFIRPGTYTLSASVSLSAGTVLVGTDWNSVEIAMNGYQFQANADNIIFTGLKLTGYAVFNAFMITGSGNNIIINKCQILQTATNNTRHTVSLTGNNCSFVDNIVQGTDQFHITGTSANVDRNRFTGIARTVGTTYFIIYMSGNDGLFTNNFVTVNDTGSSYLGNGIWISGERVICANNKFTCTTTNGQFAIYTDGIDSKIINNHIIKFGTGIYLNSDYRQVCSGNTVTGSGSNGIATSSGTNVGYGYKPITSNIIYEVGGAGIHIGTGSRIVVADNTIYDATGNGIEAYSGAGNVYYCTITGNHVSYCGGDGIYLCGGQASQATGVSVCSNTSHNNTGRGLYLIVTASTVVGNDCVNNGTANSVTDNGGSQIASNVG